MGYKKLLLTIMANAAGAYGVIRLWREKTQPPVTIEGEVADDHDGFDTWSWEHRDFHISHGMPRRFYGACGRCQAKVEPVVVTQHN